MTLKDYIQQREVKRTDTGAVVLQPHEYRINGKAHGYYSVTVLAFNYTYVVRENDTQLYSMDERGLPKNSCVFSISEPIKK